MLSACCLFAWLFLLELRNAVRHAHVTCIWYFFASATVAKSLLWGWALGCFGMFRDGRRRVC